MCGRPDSRDCETPRDADSGHHQLQWGPRGDHPGTAGGVCHTECVHQLSDVPHAQGSGAALSLKCQFTEAWLSSMMLNGFSPL